MTLTSAACPLTAVMERNIRTVLAESGTEFVLGCVQRP
jgi:metal-sulfur cluster biosynthetic enzyme